MMDEITRIQAQSPLEGFLWTWIVPAALFLVAFVATWLLYRHFAGRSDR